MKKTKNIILVILLLVITNLATYNLTTYGYVFSKNAKYAKIKHMENFIRNNFLYDVTDEMFEEGELKGVVASLNDPYSEYYTKEEYDKLKEMTSGKFYGIGVVITKGEDNLITVISSIKGSPADKAGIRAQDKILKVDGKEYTADKLNDAVSVMKGKRNTNVKITIYSPSKNKTRDIEVVRDEIKIETIIPHKIEDIGYLGITNFGDETAKDFNIELDKLLEQKIKGLIIDLRGNPGGTVDSVVKIADRILPEAMIVSAKNKDKETVFEYKSQDSTKLDIPIVVLINEGSASASEILAGAIKDNKAGTIIGKKSFGKGIVQTVFPFPKGTGLKLTTSEYFTPSGKNIHKIGINPDIEVDEPKDVEGIGIEFIKTDTQLQKAIEELNKNIIK